MHGGHSFCWPKPFAYLVWFVDTGQPTKAHLSSQKAAGRASHFAGGMWQALGCKTGIHVLQISVLWYHRECLCHPFKLLGCRFQHLWVSCDAFSNCILCPILVSFGCPDLCSIAAYVSRLSLCWCVAVCCTLAAASVYSVKKVSCIHHWLSHMGTAVNRCKDMSANVHFGQSN